MPIDHRHGVGLPLLGGCDGAIGNRLPPGIAGWSLLNAFWRSPAFAMWTKGFRDPQLPKQRSSGPDEFPAILLKKIPCLRYANVWWRQVEVRSRHEWSPTNGPHLGRCVAKVRGSLSFLRRAPSSGMAWAVMRDFYRGSAARNQLSKSRVQLIYCCQSIVVNQNYGLSGSSMGMNSSDEISSGLALAIGVCSAGEVSQPNC